MQMLQEQASAFLDFFTGKHQFYSLPNKAETGYYGTLEQNLPGLLRDNKAGKDIYFTVNETKPGIRRTKEEYIRTRAVHIDDDGIDKNGGRTDPESFPLQPNIVVHTSPGKYHYYWLTDTDDGDTTEQVLRGMADKYHGDPKTTDRTRIMRVPGFVHNGSGVQVKYEILSTEPYRWADILEAFPPLLTEPAGEKIKEESQFSVADAIADILSGDDVHGSRIRLAMHWANTGMPKKDALATLNSYVEDAMRSGSVDTRRAMERIGNMQQAVESAYKKIEAEQAVPKYIPEVKSPIFTIVPEPIGGLKEIVDDVIACMMHPSLEMATAVAMHCVSVFGGGLYHLDGKTCTRKRTILAPTGRGKSIANKYFSEIVRQMAMKDDMFNPYTFIGGSHYAVNNIHMELVEHRVRSYITTEAGLMGKSKAGTTHETRAYLLDVISGSYRQGFDGRQLSMRSAENRKVNDQLKTVYSAMPVLLSESVPDQYVDVLQSEDAFRSGDVGREEIYFIDPHKGKPNRRAKEQADSSITQRLFRLARAFEKSNTERGDNPANPDAFIAADTTAVDDRLDELFERYSEDYNRANREANYLTIALSSRMYEKILTTCLVQAIADIHMTDNTLPVPVVTAAHLDYAEALHAALAESLTSQSTGQGSLADPLEQCVDRVISFAASFGERAKDRRDAHDFNNKIVRRGWLTDVLDISKFKPMRQLISDMHGRRQAMHEVITSLEDKGVLVPVQNINSKIQLWRINL